MSRPELYLEAALAQSRLLTEIYSTSFGRSVALLHPSIRPAVYAVYGMVRVADEIVDSPHGGDAGKDIEAFRKELWRAVADGYSHNPVLHAFQWAYSKYEMERQAVDAFLDSMAMDTARTSYDRAGFERYVYGSAEAVGLMCLAVFCGGTGERYRELAKGARALGSAFQKINFLRDLKEDYQGLGRCYFPGIEPGRLTEAQKKEIEEEVAAEFDLAREYVRQLPPTARKGVALGYELYVELLREVRRVPAIKILNRRASVPALKKRLLYWKVLLTW